MNTDKQLYADGVFVGIDLALEAITGKARCQTARQEIINKRDRLAKKWKDHQDENISTTEEIVRLHRPTAPRQIGMLWAQPPYGECVRPPRAAVRIYPRSPAGPRGLWPCVKFAASVIAVIGLAWGACLFSAAFEPRYGQPLTGVYVLPTTQAH